MNNITRSTFLKQTAQVAALISIAGFSSHFATASPLRKRKFEAANDLLRRMIIANDNQVKELLKRGIDEQHFSRMVGHEFAKLSAAYCTAGSSYHHATEVVSVLEKTIAYLLKNQTADGTVNVGNLESPPDTAFLLESLTAGALLLKKEDEPALSVANNSIKNFLIKAGEALVTGGVHTPNHRWVICAALARLNVLYPNKKYAARIDEWLSEGIFNDADGHYPERSMNYANVENNSMITMARLLNMPTLFAPVRRNLDLVYYCSEPDGDLVTNESRRQDQYTEKSIVEFYLHYRYMAIRDNSPKLAGIATLIESLPGFEEKVIDDSIYHFLENDLLQKPLPAVTPPPINYDKLFATSHLLRIRRSDTTVTLFGGADLPITIASGRSNSPNFFAYRKGNAILDYMRLSTRFFGTGYFYSDGLRKMGNQYLLSKKLNVPYYQPLPKNLQNKAGDYKLSPSIDDRFWNKMDFKNRPVSNVKTLDTKVTLTETDGKAALDFAISGLPGVEVTIELCFKIGGKLTGVSKGENDNYFLEEGSGKYEMNGNIISFGPGIAKHKNISGLEGERYSTHFGNLRTEGMHVYLTGITPFSHQLTFS